MSRNLMLSSVLTFALFFAGVAQDATVNAPGDMQKLRSLLNDANDCFERKRAAELFSISDNYVFIRDDCPKMLELELVSALQWRVVLDSLDAIADSDAKKAIVLIACTRWLETRPYVEFLDGVLSLIEQGQLDRYFFQLVSLPSDESSEGWGLLVMRASIDPQVRRIVERARALFWDQEHQVQSYNEILSGDAFRRSFPVKYFVHSHRKFLTQMALGASLLTFYLFYLLFKRYRAIGNPACYKTIHRN